MKKAKPCFLGTSDRVFTEILSKAASDKLNIAECLNTKEKVELVRQLSEATSQLYYVELQQQLWQEYYNVGIKDNVWGMKISKRKAKWLATSRGFGYPRHTVEQRRITIAKQIKHAIDNQEMYATQLRNDVEHWKPPIDATALIETICELVKNEQRQLRQEFDFKKNLLFMNLNDHHLINEFFDLQPTDDEVSFALNK